MSKEISDARDRGRISLSGEWTIERAGELKGLLADELGKAEQVVVDLAGVGELDLSCLQLLCAAHRSGIALQKSVTLAGTDNAALRRTVVAAGYARSIGCHNDPLKDCLWTGGWTE